jgi:hypothetical protein
MSKYKPLVELLEERNAPGYYWPKPYPTAGFLEFVEVQYDAKLATITSTALSWTDNSDTTQHPKVDLKVYSGTNLISTDSNVAAGSAWSATTTDANKVSATVKGVSFDHGTGNQLGSETYTVTAPTADTCQFTWYTTTGQPIAAYGVSVGAAPTIKYSLFARIIYGNGYTDAQHDATGTLQFYNPTTTNWDTIATNSIDFAHQSSGLELIQKQGGGLPGWSGSTYIDNMGEMRFRLVVKLANGTQVGLVTYTVTPTHS